MARQWDGEMITTILIVLVAVVVLIVIIAVLALRYLRADDSDTFDDIPDEPRPRRGSDHDSGELPVAPPRRRQQREPATQAWAADRPARSADARSQQPGYRDRDTGPRPAVAERPGSNGGQRRPVAAARQTRAARADDADAAANSWESLSDVDYWAELAADKPPAAAGSGSARRPGEMPSSDQRQPVGAPTAGRGDHSQISMQRRQPAWPVSSLPGRGGESPPAVPPAGFEPPGRRGAPRPSAMPRPTAAQRPATGPRSVLPRRPQLPGAPMPPATGHPGRGGPADDDPLTSPSFPAINAADSRSYRTRRSGTSQPGMPGPNGHPAGADRSSRPDGYPVQSPAQQSVARHAAGPQPAAQAPSLPPPSSTPAANPYGSYLSTPSPSQPPGYSDSAAASRPTDYPGYPAAAPPTAGSGWYPAPALGNGGTAGPAATDGYLSAAGLGAPATSHHAHNGTRGYTGIDYGSLRYDDPPYPDTDGSGLLDYAASSQPTRQYEQNGHPANPDLGYSQDGYQRNPGYGSGR
jgi:hypothetical protein